MDITEVPLNQDTKGKKKKNKKSKKKSVSQEGNGEGSGVEKKEEEERMKSEPDGPAFPPAFSVSEIKNKQRRHLMFMKLKQEKRKVTTDTQTKQSSH